MDHIFLETWFDLSSTSDFKKSDGHISLQFPRLPSLPSAQRFHLYPLPDPSGHLSLHDVLDSILELVNICIA